jgi:hypothetical protein
MRKLRKLTIDVAKFLADYNDAVESGMTVREFCTVTGLAIGTLHGRIETLARRGVVLPLLKGMKKRTKMGRRLLGLPAEKPQPAPAPAAEEKVQGAAPPTFQVFVGSGF